MPLYEGVYIARQDISAAQVEAINEALTGLIEQNGGKVTKTEYWGLKNLAYRIKKNRKGHYTLLNIDAPVPALHEIEHALRFNEDVLRYMVLRVDELEEGPSAMMQNRGGREERGRRPGGGGGRFRDGPRDGPRDGGRGRGDDDRSDNDSSDRNETASASAEGDDS